MKNSLTCTTEQESRKKHFLSPSPGYWGSFELIAAKVCSKSVERSVGVPNGNINLLHDSEEVYARRLDTTMSTILVAMR